MLTPLTIATYQHVNTHDKQSHAFGNQYTIADSVKDRTF